jgi:hypothetical protein
MKTRARLLLDRLGVALLVALYFAAVVFDALRRRCHGPAADADADRKVSR